MCIQIDNRFTCAVAIDPSTEMRIVRWLSQGWSFYFYAVSRLIVSFKVLFFQIHPHYTQHAFNQFDPYAHFMDKLKCLSDVWKCLLVGGETANASFHS